MLPRKNSRKYQWWCHFHPAKLEPWLQTSMLFQSMSHIRETWQI
jgi:hypothetical protein